MELRLTYYFNGSSCTSIKLEETDYGYINVWTNYNEFITFIYSATELSNIINALREGNLHRI